MDWTSIGQSIPGTPQPDDLGTVRPGPRWREHLHRAAWGPIHTQAFPTPVCVPTRLPGGHGRPENHVVPTHIFRSHGAPGYSVSLRVTPAEPSPSRGTIAVLKKQTGTIQISPVFTEKRTHVHQKRQDPQDHRDHEDPQGAGVVPARTSRETGGSLRFPACRKHDQDNAGSSPIDPAGRGAWSRWWSLPAAHRPTTPLDGDVSLPAGQNLSFFPADRDVTAFPLVFAHWIVKWAYS